MSRGGTKGSIKSAQKSSALPKAKAPAVPAAVPRILAQTEKVRLLWVHSKCEFVSKLFNVILREVCSYLGHDPYLISITNRSALNIFDVMTNKWSKCTLKSEVRSNPSARFAQINSEQFIYCGGTPNRKMRGPFKCKAMSSNSEAYLISMNGTVEVLPSMHYRRAWHGLTHLNSEVFVFAGLENPLDQADVLVSCEVMLLREKQWEDLPNLQVPRELFNPTLWRGEVYLCGGTVSGAIEVFTPERRSFRVLETRLPEPECVLSYVHNNELVVIQTTSFLVFNQSAEGMTTRREERPCEYYRFHSPVVIKGKVYAIETNEVVVFNANTGTKGQNFPISRG